jgi:hypothetical protein
MPTANLIRCQAFIDDLNELAGRYGTTLLDRVTLAVVVLHELTYADFMEVDERPGQFDVPKDGTTYGAWHVALRRARNNPEVDLFNALAEEPAK